MSVDRLAPGELFAGDFVVERALKEGGMGAVYVAVQRSTGARRALKIMQGALVDNLRARERFFQEARLGAAIGSAHVVEVIGAGIDEATGTPWLAMEFLEGQDLDGAVRSHGAMTWPQARELFGQLGDALARAHARGIVHRDLKPENVFVAAPRRPGASFTVKLLDLGIATLIAEGRTAATVTSALGSPVYMAPEQATRGAHVRPATDVWALGLIAFFALTARHYWLAAQGDGELTALLGELLYGSLEPASVRAAALGVPAGVLPPGFDAWFARCVMRDPTARLPDASVALGLLDAVLAGAVPEALRGALPTQPVYGHPAAVAAQRPPERAPSRSRVVAVVAAVAVAAVAVAAVAVAPRGERVASRVATALPHRGPRCVVRSLGARSHWPRARAISVGIGSTCVVADDGVWCAGRPPQEYPWAYPAASIPDRSNPVRVLALPGVEAVSTSGICACALRGGAVQCWGVALFGFTVTPTPSGVTDVESLSVSDLQACVVLRDGRFRCWSRAAVTEPDLRSVRTVSAQAAHTCALLRDGTVWCWGANDGGEIGNGHIGGNAAEPSPVLGLAGATQVSAGRDHTCARTADGAVRCWGANASGQLGDGSRDNRPSPVAVRGLPPVVEVSAGNRFACARTAAGRVWCWGVNTECECGTAPPGSAAAPAEVGGIDGAVAVSAGYSHACALLRDGAVRCWGTNYVGEFGDDSPRGERAAVEP